ncbi:MAG: hypothetical protein QJR12_05150 [Mycobacterium sp.]|uniref:hypothetical protein n=1 Tax=Mycobacterium sp. TaxID=1785 RepID=UPI002620FE49|nr:hypothetical protein [Mycobacterium sp.]MDI3313676.1 hypothetical protein [Mycobacterium sp.]
MVAHDQHITGELKTVSAGWGTLTFEESGGAQPLDNRTVKDAPPPSTPPYPVNDVIAEATDLDGNHVILRRVTTMHDPSSANQANQTLFFGVAIRWKTISPSVFRIFLTHIATRPRQELRQQHANRVKTGRWSASLADMPIRDEQLFSPAKAVADQYITVALSFTAGSRPSGSSGLARSMDQCASRTSRRCVVRAAIVGHRPM